MTGHLALAMVLLAAAMVLVVLMRWRRRNAGPRRHDGRPGPLRAEGLHDDSVVDRATDWVHARMSVCRMQLAEARTCVRAVHAYVRSNSAPMNGGGTRSGYLVPPNMFDVVQDLLAKASSAGISLADECAWEIVRLHDDYLRSRR